MPMRSTVSYPVKEGKFCSGTGNGRPGRRREVGDERAILHRGTVRNATHSRRP